MMIESPNSLTSSFEPSPLASNIPQESGGLSIGDKSIGSELRSKGAVMPSHWRPQHDYEDVSIGELASGRRRVSFTARVVNLSHRSVHGKMPRQAKGCLNVLVKDDSALILVCLLSSSYPR